VIAGSGDETVRIWDLDFPRQVGLSTLSGHSGYVRSVTYSPDGTFLASAGGEGEIRIWSQMHGSLVRQIQDVYGGDIWDLIYSPDGAYLVSCASNYARVWDTATGARVATLRGHRKDVERAFFTPEGRYLITIAKDEQALIWRTEDWTLDQRVAIPPGGLWGGALSDQGDRLALGYLGGNLHLFDVRETERGLSVTAAVTLTGHSSYVPALDFSPDGRYLASGAWDGLARIWSMETMTTVVTPLEHPAFVYDVAFSPDGQYLATAARDSQVRLWRLERFPARPPTLVAVLSGHTDPVVYTLDFGPDGDYLASGSWDGTIRRYMVRFEDVLDLSWQYVGSKLDAESSAEEGNRE
jgi:WD40 repeat protein